MPAHPRPPFQSSPSPSVVRRLAVWIGAIGSLALLSILASMIVVELSSGEARAINLAGSLRMQSYVIQAAALQPGTGRLTEALTEFEERFAHPDLHDILPHSPEAPSRLAYQVVEAHWTQHFRPAALQLHVGQIRPQTLEKLTRDQVGYINQLVALIEEGLEAKLQFLRWVQGISLLLLALVGAGAVIQLKRRVVSPLGELLEAAHRVRKGDFSSRIQPRAPDELGQLGAAFNFMVDDLSLSYAQLEQRVADKTAELARSNQSLELLYRTTRTLSEPIPGPRALEQVLNDVAQVFTSPGIALGLLDGARIEWLQSAGPEGGSALPPELLAPPLPPGDGGLSCQALSNAPGTSRACAPLFDGQHNHGWLILLLPLGQTLAPWQIPLLQSVGHHVGTALAHRERTRQEHRLALLDERAVIARELHDSLAQSLSYLKIQVARLQNLLGRAPQPAPVQEVVDELRDGLNGAYRQLRELLTTFRLRMDGRGLRDALEETVQEFRRRSDLAIHLALEALPRELGPSREIHVLQIIREALSNVERHAQARNAWIRLSARPEGCLEATVDDDGHGFDPAQRPSHRYGINIMHDRAESLHGQLNVAPRAAGGTRVELRFPATAPANAPENPFKTP
ncbi:MAG: histidine kinase [Zoogloea sp.]|uniref:histidine kinase n=1 Tax=Zoogloea sp. TaxID=49181 RepID=UPI003F39B9E2